jgi:hypothetical protein
VKVQILEVRKLVVPLAVGLGIQVQVFHYSFLDRSVVFWEVDHLVMLDLLGSANHERDP